MSAFHPKRTPVCEPFFLFRGRPGDADEGGEEGLGFRFGGKDGSMPARPPSSNVCQRPIADISEAAILTGNW